MTAGRFCASIATWHLLNGKLPSLFRFKALHTEREPGLVILCFAGIEPELHANVRPSTASSGLPIPGHIRRGGSGILLPQWYNYPSCGQDGSAGLANLRDTLLQANGALRRSGALIVADKDML